MGEEK